MGGHCKDPQRNVKSSELWEQDEGKKEGEMGEIFP